VRQIIREVAYLLIPAVEDLTFISKIVYFDNAELETTVVVSN
jgi:hypothetical protein